jgi:uncharacterized protein
MNSLLIRNATEADFSAILKLNGAVSQFTSLLAIERLTSMFELSSYHKVICLNGEVAGFLIAMRTGDVYVNPNFEWFSSRYESFLYVDRIVVSADCAGMKLGSLFYEDLFAFAREAKLPYVTCEYYIDPPNDRSKHFHDKFGFTQVGVRTVGDTDNEVSMQIART